MTRNLEKMETLLSLDISSAVTFQSQFFARSWQSGEDHARCLTYADNGGYGAGRGGNGVQVCRMLNRLTNEREQHLFKRILKFEKHNKSDNECS